MLCHETTIDQRLFEKRELTSIDNTVMASKYTNRLFPDSNNELASNPTYMESYSMTPNMSKSAAERRIDDQRNHVFRGGSRRGSLNTSSAGSQDLDRTDPSNSCTHKSRESGHRSRTTKKSINPIRQQELCQRVWESPETDTLFTSSDEGGTITGKEESIRFHLLLEDMQPDTTASRPKGIPKKDLPPIIIGFHKSDDEGFVAEDDSAINELLDDIELQLNDMNTIVGSSTVGESSEGTKSLAYMENNDANAGGYDEVLRWLESKKQKDWNASVKSTSEYQDTRQDIATAVNGKDPLSTSTLEAKASNIPAGTDKATGSNSSNKRMETKNEPPKPTNCCRSILPSTCIVKLVFIFCVLIAGASIYFLVAVIVARYSSIQMLPFSVMDG